MEKITLRNSVYERKSNITSVKKENGHSKISDYYGDLVFNFQKSSIPEAVKKELVEISYSGKRLNRELAEIVANEVLSWAIQKGATHFCHWFQPLTGGTAEKHDSFLSFDANKRPLETLSAKQLMQGEPDASSFPHGGSRSTFEARGYTSWDLSSPMFLRKTTLCIPTAFVSYSGGDALDIKTPLLRSISKLDASATRFLELSGEKVDHVVATCGCEQEYFLVDKAFYFNRPDLVMTGRTLFGRATAKNQQLSDHYFGVIPSRIFNFMEDLDYTLHRLGVPAKNRHNEVAPGQFEIAPIFTDANVAADHNQLLMATIKETAETHNLVALLHEKPFYGINGSGKHVNWSMETNTGINLLEPSEGPHNNHRFLAMVSIIVEAVNRHAKPLRMAIAGHGNDHRLGANEAPPSIMSVFLGETLFKIFESIMDDKDFIPNSDNYLDIGAKQLATLLRDNTDRNRTSPFAFTGNKFEFRAVGSSQAVGFPLSILNGAVAQVLEESNQILENEIKNQASVEEALLKITRKWIKNSWKVVFNGDGYADDWVEEAKRRGLPNLPSTADALCVLKDADAMSFLTETGIFRPTELQTRYNVLLERFVMLRMIEFSTLCDLVFQKVIPAGIEYKKTLSQIIKYQRDFKVNSIIEMDIYKQITHRLEDLLLATNDLQKKMTNLDQNHEIASFEIVKELLPLSETIAAYCNDIEKITPDSHWVLPTYYDMLFLR